MLVQTMSWDEIYRELTQDRIEVISKMMVKLKVAPQVMVRRKKKQLSEVFHFVTRRKNNWSVAISINEKQELANFYIKSFDKIGVIAFSLIDYEEGCMLLKFNTHFIKRYRERMHLDEMIKPEAVIKHFFKNNEASNPIVSKDPVNDKGLYAVWISFDSGIGVGIANLEKQIIHMKTFVAKELFNEKQEEIVALLEKEESTEVKVYMNPEHFKGDL